MSSRVVVTTVVTPTAELGRRWTAISVCARAVPMNTSPSGMSASRDGPRRIASNPHAEAVTTAAPVRENRGGGAPHPPPPRLTHPPPPLPNNPPPQTPPKTPPPPRG